MNLNTRLRKVVATLQSIQKTAVMNENLRYLVTTAVQDINNAARSIKNDNRYKAQSILEDVIKVLSGVDVDAEPNQVSNDDYATERAAAVSIAADLEASLKRLAPKAGDLRAELIAELESRV